MTDYEKLSLQIQAALLRVHSDMLSAVSFLVARTIAQQQQVSDKEASRLGLLQKQATDDAAKISEAVAKATQ
jgi:hypothetical protein